MEQEFWALPRMAVMNSALRPISPNRRRRVRHKIQTPAYASFTAEAQSALLELHEIVDISEDGMAIQCHAPLKSEERVDLCLDLADCPERIYTTGQVIWSNPSGRAGLRFSELPPETLSRLRQWLFVNVTAAVAHGESRPYPVPTQEDIPLLPNFSDTLAAATAVQRQVEALGSDLPAALQLIAGRVQTLVRASGAAIALSEDGSDSDLPSGGDMVCRASSGPDAPPVGARLQVGSGFSGECVKTGALLRCNDTEDDPRVDRESCRALGIRSMLAVPVRMGEKSTNEKSTAEKSPAEKSVGILEVFSAQPNTFSESDGKLLQRFAEIVQAALNRAARAQDLLVPTPVAVSTDFSPSPGSVLFASLPAQEKKIDSLEKKPAKSSEEKMFSGISLPRSHLILLVCAAAAIALVLGYNLAPLIQSKMQGHGHMAMQSVLASFQPPKSERAKPDSAAPDSSASDHPQLSPTPASDASSFQLMRQMAQDGDAVAENALGLRYFQGDEKNSIQRDEKQAFYWFNRAANHGSLTAQAKLAFLYWGGRGVSKDVNRAYFWSVLARARGDEQSKDLAAVLASGMTRPQATVIERQADLWLQEHLGKKPGAGY